MALPGDHRPLGGSILYLVIGSIGYPVGTVIMAFVVDRIERKLLILTATLVWQAGLLAMAGPTATGRLLEQVPE